MPKTSSVLLMGTSITSIFISTQVTAAASRRAVTTLPADMITKGAEIEFGNATRFPALRLIPRTKLLSLPPRARPFPPVLRCRLRLRPPPRRAAGRAASPLPAAAGQPTRPTSPHQRARNDAHYQFRPERHLPQTISLPSAAG